MATHRFEWLRRNDPVSWQPEPPPNHGYWAVTRYRDVEAVISDPRVFSSAQGVLLEEMRPDEIEARRSILETDPPDHTRLRKLVAPHFTPAAVRQYEADCRGLADGLIERAISKGRFDFVEEIAAQLPIRILGRVLGVPEEDSAQLIEWGNEMIGHFDPEYAEIVVGRDDISPYRLLPFRSPAALKMMEYGNAMAELRRADPRSDLVSRLVQGMPDGDKLTTAEFGNFFVLLVVAGNETTRHAISHGTLALLQHPDQMRLLISHRELIVPAVEEILRWSTPAIYFRRTAARDVQLGERSVRAGDKVVMWLVSANYDHEVFGNPSHFDVGREANRHFAFGRSGPHFCLGAHLSRLEMRIVFQQLVERLPELELDGEPARLRSNLVNGIKHMPMRVRPRSAVTSVVAV